MDGEVYVNFNRELGGVWSLMFVAICNCSVECDQFV